MVICTVTNSTSITCENGCCGTADTRSCCDIALSDNVIIVVCVVGALVVVAVVVALIVCLTKKHKNRVTRIRPHRRQQTNEVSERRARRIDIPNPPPYTESPPQYDSIDFTADSRSNPRSTDPILPGQIDRANVRRGPLNQRYDQRTDPINDGPPSYISVVQLDSNMNIPNRVDSPQPGTSGMGNNFVSRPRDVDSSVRTILERTRHGSPHPSLASGRISAAMLHRTVSERSRKDTPLDGVSSRRQLLDRGDNSITPVTIREITVHSQTRIQPNSNDKNNDAEKRNKGKKISKLPIPIHKQTENFQSKENNELLQNNSVNISATKTSELDNDPPSRPVSPTATNPSAAKRSSQRRAILNILHQRKNNLSIEEMD